MHTPQFKNTLLSHFSSDTIARLGLRRVELPQRHTLAIAGEAIRSLYFLEEGIGSMTTSFENGTTVEVSMFGFESVVGVSALMGVKQSLNPVFMQLGGYGYVCTTAVALNEFETNPQFRSLMLRYVQAQLTLAMQAAACNATHTYEQRLARWLLICSERAHRDALDVPQEFVAQMLGSTRSTVSIAASHLKEKGLIEYSRGKIGLLDKVGLEEQACECYRAVRNYLQSFAAFDTDYIT